MKVTITGIDDVLAKLKKVETIDKALQEACLELIEEAEQIVLQAYGTQGDGNCDYVTEIVPMPNGCKLVVSGADVGFLEFGAGTMTDGGDIFATEVDYAVAPGSWSEVHSKRFSEHGFWYWMKHRYEYIMPTRGAERALEYCRNHWREAVERKVNEWIG